jgi:hypothetical protein
VNEKSLFAIVAKQLLCLLQSITASTFALLRRCAPRRRRAGRSGPQLRTGGAE